ncbi:hypothetical protein NM688_g5985 [Phlebia brevispora]|uniref:Uncharacterized protein n=1 Tax=Phlebia brevispora TaxID=194682 RepID=A0ACC1SLR8_9APHY|nr:hypothetical protein NM688_g5985 [Phlebia brevispora]
MLSNLPTEILLKIFRFACLDDGRAGRSLSAVSRSIRTISAEFRYQSLALEITRARTTKLLLQTLNATPEHLRRIRHLYIDRSRIHAVLTDPWFGVDMPTRYKKEKETGRDLRELLRLAAPHLQTLTLIFLAGVKQSLEKGDLHLEELQMPMLQELTIDCPMRLFRRISPSFAPSLVRLCIPSRLLIEQFGRSAATTFPRLTQLLILPMKYMTAEQWRCLRSLMYTMRLHSSIYAHGPDVTQLDVLSHRPRRYITVQPYYAANNAKGGIDSRQHTLAECLKKLFGAVSTFYRAPLRVRTAGRGQGTSFSGVEGELDEKHSRTQGGLALSQGDNCEYGHERSWCSYITLGHLPFLVLRSDLFSCYNCNRR